MSKFIIINDMREAVGVEEQVGRKTVLNVDHIQSIEGVEDHIAHVLNYRSVVTMSSGAVFFASEYQADIMNLING